MTLLLTTEDVQDLISIDDAIAVTETVVKEEAAGTVIQVPPFGGAHATAGGGFLRMVGGGAQSANRIGFRAGLGGENVALVFEMQTNRLLAIVSHVFSNVRLSACIGLAARELAQPGARRIGLVGSGRTALPSLRGLCAVRPIDQILVYSPTPEHRTEFARRAAEALDIDVKAVDTVEAAVADVDIIAVSTSAQKPVLLGEHLRPGVHVNAMGTTHELDESVYLRADQIVASSRHLELEYTNPMIEFQGLPTPPLQQLVADHRLRSEDVVELGAIVAGDVPARNGPSDISVFRESRGGVGDVLLANLAYERARQIGRGVEFQF
jgi:ornithine cyclodeaminase/alanine dehydrogenase-like protein (mu-crystallin family)